MASWDAKQEELSKAVDAMLGKMETEKIRPASRNMYLKMAECYNSKSASTKDVERCLQEASTPAKMMQNAIQGELGQFQNRLQRCLMECQDEVSDKFRTVTADNESAARAHNEKCAVRCADKHIAMLGGVKSNLEQKLNEILK